MTRILLTGRDGQVGRELCRTLQTLGEVVALSRNDLDLSRPEAIRDTVRSVKPQWIVNAAAYTAVDKAESEPDLAKAINAQAPRIMAEEGRRIGAGMIHYSTDYVFDGMKNAPYTEEDVPNPLNVYGRTKLGGDEAIRAAGVPHLILRTSWVYAARGRNFLLTMLRLAAEREELRIVSDQIGAPTWSRSIAEATARIFTRWRDSLERSSGVYNLAAAGATSWFGFTEEILRRTAPAKGKSRPRLVAISSSDYPTAARRPLNSRLSCEKARKEFGVEMPDWRTDLSQCLQELDTTREAAQNSPLPLRERGRGEGDE